MAGATDHYPARVGRVAGRGRPRRHRRSPACAGIAAVDGGWRIGALDDLDRPRRGRPAAAVRRAEARRRATVGGRQIQNARHGRRQRLQRLAGGRRRAQPAGARRRGRAGVAPGRAAPAGRRVHHRQPPDRAARPDELVTGRPRAGPLPARRARSTFLKLGARRYLVISIAMVGGDRRDRRDGADRGGADRGRRLLGGAAAAAGAGGGARRRARLDAGARRDARRGRAPRAARADRRRARHAPPTAARRRSTLRAPRCSRSCSRDDRGRSTANRAELRGQRATVAVAGRPDAPAVRRAARRSRADRHQGRLRRGRLRRLHGAARRPAGLRLPRRRWARCDGRRVDDGRGRWRDADGALAALQAAFLAHGAAQCGICTPGMLMAAERPARAAIPTPDRRASPDALGGVLCRCTGYRKIVEAVAATRDARAARPRGRGAALGAASGHAEGPARPRTGGAAACPRSTACRASLGTRPLRRRAAADGRPDRARRAVAARASAIRDRRPRRRFVPGTPGSSDAHRRGCPRPEPLRHLPDSKDQPVLADG